MFFTPPPDLDLAHLVRDLEGALRRRGARTQAHPVGGLLVFGSVARTALATFVLESERIQRAVVTHVRATPFTEGLALVVHPRAELDAPVLVGELLVTPAGRAHALLDAAGPGIAHASFAEAFGRPLARIIDDPRGFRRSTVPAWLAPVSGGGGGSLRAGRGEAGTLTGVVLRYVETYLAALDHAPRAPDDSAARANLVSARMVRDLIRSRGAAKERLAPAFGEREAEQYLRLFWREDERA
jgi:hypothetical protein